MVDVPAVTPDVAPVVALCYSPNWTSYAEIEAFAIRQTNPGARVYLISDSTGKPAPAPGCTFIDVERLYRQRIPSAINVDGRFTQYALYRLLLPEIIPDARLLYVDADALVVSSLQDLWQRGLDGGALVAGVRDVGILESQLRDIGLSPGDVYINAGVTLMDLHGIRAAGLPAEWLRLINSRHFSCHDQDVINMTCQGRINLVGNEWNSSLSTGFAPDPKIMHWAGGASDKPWCNYRVHRHDLWARWAALHALEVAVR